MSRCGFLSHFNRINRCVHLRVGLLAHGGIPHTRFCVNFTVVLVFDTLLTFASICSNSFVHCFVAICGFTILNILILDRAVDCRNGCLSKLVDHGRSVLGLLHTGCCIRYTLLYVPLIVVVLPVARNGVSLLYTLTYFFLADKFAL